MEWMNAPHQRHHEHDQTHYISRHTVAALGIFLKVIIKKLKL